MKCIHPLSLLCCFLLRAGMANCQQQVQFQQLFIAGKSDIGFIAAFVQDASGYLWIGTNKGLHRFDGYHDKVYTYEPGDSSSLSSNAIESVFADSKGNIWAGTKATGLDMLNPATGKFTHYQFHGEGKPGIVDGQVNGIAEDKQGTIWFGTETGLSSIDSSRKKIKRYYFNDKDSTSISCNVVRMVYVDRENNVWAATGSPWTWPPREKDGGLCLYLRASDNFRRFEHSDTDSTTLADNRVRSLFEDSRGVLWIGTTGDGLHTMDLKNFSIQRHPYRPGQPSLLSRSRVNERYQACYDHITFITEDLRGNIWIGTYGNGLSVFDREKNSMQHFNAAAGYTNDQPGIHLWSGFTAKDGTVFIGTWENKIFTVNPFAVKIIHVQTGERVFTVKEDSFTRLIGTESQLIVVKKNRQGPQPDTVRLQDGKGISGKMVSRIFKAPGKAWWIAPENPGLFHYEPSSGKIEFVGYDASDRVTDLLYNTDSLLLLGTQGGLDQLNLRSGKTSDYYHRAPGTFFGTEWITKLKDNADGSLWIGYHNGIGIVLLDKKKNIAQQYLKGNSIQDFYTDKKNVFWVATDFGLYAYDRIKKSFTLFQSSQLNLDGVNVAGLLGDSLDNLYAYSSIGIIRINAERNHLALYGSRYGLDLPKMIWSELIQCSQGTDGDLYFPDGTGYYVLNPSHVPVDTLAPGIIFSSLQVSGKQDPASSSFPISAGSNQVELGYQNNSFSITITPVHFMQPESNRIKYILENAGGESWREGTGEQVAYYNNLPPDKYILRVRAYNADGAWREQLLQIVVHPPWWKTWWAILFFLAVVLLILFSAFRIRISNLHAKQEEQIKTMVATQEEERKHLSRELHDDVGTKLSALKLFISSFKHAMLENKNRQAIQTAADAEQLIDETVKDVREMLLNLSPTVLDEFGYLTAVESLVNKINAAQLIEFRLISFGLSQRLPKEYELALYRITQELVNNILKHAHASHVSLEFGYRDQCIILMVVDDGTGFDTSRQSQGYGLKNLHARSKLLRGEIYVDSKPGAGTSVLLQIPYQFT